MDGWYIILALAIIYLFSCWSSTREGFVSKRAEQIYAASQPLYSERGNATTYSEFKVRLEPVVNDVGVDIFTDTKRLYVNNPSAYSPEVVQQAIAA